MIFVDNENITDPRINLAIEEHLLRNVFAGEDLLLFYVNAPSIIIGRNQNTLAEINPRYVDAHGIIVVRRLSGGGAVYHDAGNLNVSVIVPRTEYVEQKQYDLIFQCLEKSKQSESYWRVSANPARLVWKRWKKRHPPPCAPG